MSKIVEYGEFVKLNELLQNNNLVDKIDYTLLAPSATKEDIIELCAKADKLGVKSVCVLPKMVSVAAYVLRESEVLVCTVVSFPHGTDKTAQKLSETKHCIMDGADEVDMVLNYPALKSTFEAEEDNLVNDVRTLVNECHKHQNKDDEWITLKVIVESGLLNEEETEEATYICMEGGADFIKTSTGMVAVGAELDKVQIMRKIIKQNHSDMKIKASGGIRTMSDLQKFAPLVDRFGVGFGSVDQIFGGAEKTTQSLY
jgi:deoxyribose-phosphate aldolase